MARINDDLINEIRIHTDIVDIISGYVPLTKRGKNYFGVCPFHDDHSPSMSVDPTKQIYKCFSCGAGGNVFTFVMNYENISFIDAVKLLGSKLGYNLSGIDSGGSVNTKEYSAYELVHKYYQNNIYTTMGKNALEYLNKRQINLDIIKKFGIGLSLKDNKISDMLIQKGYSAQDIINLGLINEDNTDFFLNRIIFPIWDLNGRVVAFSGRVYNTTSSSKYVNSKESKIFKKSNILYNYHNAKSILKKSDYVIVMEGFLDVIRASTIGIDNCVATLGTAITKEHINLLKKMSDNIILCFDGDNAGEKATITCANMLNEVGIKPKIVRLEEELDPDEYILKYGKDRFISKINNPLSLIDFNLNILRGNKNLNEIDDVSKYINEVLIELLKEKDDIKIDLILNKMSLEYNISYDSLKSKFNKLKLNSNNNKKNEIKVIKKTEHLAQHVRAEKALLYYMLRSDEVINIVENRVSYMPEVEYRNLCNEIIYFYHKYGKLILADFYTYIMNNKQDLFKTLGEVDNLELPDDYSYEAIDDYILAIKRANIKQRNDNLKKRITEEVDIIEKAKLANSKFKLKMERGEL